MTKTTSLVTIAAALMLSAAVPAQALDLGLGGTSVSTGSGDNGGTAVSLGSGDTSAGVTLGGGSNIASIGTGTGGTGVNVGIGNTAGDLITTNTDNGVGANVNLGSLGLGGANDILNGVTDPLGNTLDGIDLGGLPAGGGGAGGGGGIPPGPRAALLYHLDAPGGRSTRAPRPPR